MDWLPEWLFEGILAVYAVLGVTSAILFIRWRKKRRKELLIGSAVLAAFFVLYLLLDVLVETDREQITNIFRELAEETRQREIGTGFRAGEFRPIMPTDYDRIFSHISDTYNRHGMNKSAFKESAPHLVTMQRVRVSQFEYPSDYKQKESPDDECANIAHVRFLLTLTLGDGLWENVSAIEAVMHRDDDGKWRVQSWEAFNPKRSPERPIELNELP